MHRASRPQRAVLHLAWLVGILGCAAETQEIAGTPQAATQADEDVLACTAELMTGLDGHADACPGPWEYVKHAMCSRTTEACGMRCVQWNTCTHWSFGAIPDPDHVIVTERYTVGQACSPPVCTGGIGRRPVQCTKPICHADFDEMTDRCDAEGAAALQRERNKIPSQHRSQVRLVRAMPRGLGKVGTRYQAECTIEIETVVPEDGSGAVCGCRVETPRTCTRRHPSCPPDDERYTSAPNQTWDMLQTSDPEAYIEDDASGPRCTSCTDLPMSTPAEARAKLACLRATYEGREENPPPSGGGGGGGGPVGPVIVRPDLPVLGGMRRAPTDETMPARQPGASTNVAPLLAVGAPAAAPTNRTVLAASVVADDPQAASVVRDLRLLYELRGEWLPEEAREMIRALYREAPTTEHDCGGNPALPALVLGCDPLVVPDVARDFGRCARLAADHASTGVAALELESCFVPLREIIEMDDAECGSPEGREQAYLLGRALLLKALRHYEESEAPTSTVGRALLAIDRWSDLAFLRVSIDGDGGGADDDGADDDADDGGDSGDGGPFGGSSGGPFGGEEEAEVPDGYEALSLEDRVDADLSRAFGVFWKAHESRYRILDALSEAPDLEVALTEATESGLAADRAVLLAAFSDSTTLPAITGPDGQVLASAISLANGPLRGLPLLTLVGDALGGMTGRLQDLSVFHDFACRVLECGGVTETEVSQLWALLAAMDDADALRDAVDGAAPLGGWRNVFDHMHVVHGRLSQAIVAADEASDPSGGIDPLFALDRRAWPQSVQAFSQILLEAQDRARSFADSGQFRASPRVLSAGLNVAQQEQILTRLGAEVGALDGARLAFETDLVTIVDGLLAMEENERARASMQDRMVILAAQYDDLEDDLTGLARNMREDADTFDDLVAAYRAVQSSIDDGGYMRLMDPGTRERTFRGSDARYDFANHYNVAALSPDAPIRIAGGRLLSVRTENEYAPTCALRDLEIYREDGTLQSLTFTGVTVGPEGFQLTQTDGTFSATSQDHVNGTTTRDSYGIRGEVCANASWSPAGVVPAVGDAVGGFSYGFSASACAFYSHSTEHFDTESTSERDGAERRTTASFQSGLRLRNTPFPDLPAGALLAVVMAPDQTQRAYVRDVQVLARPETAVFVEEESDVYFVVNDFRCETPDDAGGVRATYGVLIPNSAVAAAAVEAMGQTIGTIRNARDQFIRQGTLLSGDAAALRSGARLELESRLEDLSVAELPPPLHALFNAFLDREIAGVERAVRQLQLMRQSDQIQLEMLALARDMKRLQDLGRLAVLVPGWRLRNLDGDQLRLQARETLDGARRFLLPLLEVWFPAALRTLRTGSAGNALRTSLSHLLDAQVGTWTPELVGHAVSALQTLLTTYATHAPGDPSSPFKPVVALSFPNDGSSITATDGSSAEAEYSELPKTELELGLEPTRAALVWDAIDFRGEATFTIRPEDVYRLGGNAGTLSCSEGTPVIERMALVVITNDSSADAVQTLAALNQGRFLTGRAPAEQGYLGEAGLVRYQLDDPRWERFDVPLIYSSHLTPIDTFRQLILQDPDTRPDGALGLSAFGSFTVDMGPLEDMAASAVGDGMENAVEIALVMQVSTRDIVPLASDVVASCGAGLLP